MKEKKVYPWTLRDELGIELWNKIQSHPQGGQWKEGFPATGLMLNSASDPNGQIALSMVAEDTISAYKRDAPIEIIKFALHQVIKWRTILLETQPRKDILVEGEISLDLLHTELKGKLPEVVLTSLFQ